MSNLKNTIYGTQFFFHLISPAKLSITKIFFYQLRIFELTFLLEYSPHFFRKTSEENRAKKTAKKVDFTCMSGHGEGS